VSFFLLTAHDDELLLARNPARRSQNMVNATPTRLLGSVAPRRFEAQFIARSEYEMPRGRQAIKHRPCELARADLVTAARRSQSRNR
jgi:hypothetical protein